MSNTFIGFEDKDDYEYEIQLRPVQTPNFSWAEQAYSGTLTRREIVWANASLGELRRDKEKLSSPISCEFVRVKAS